ncbi:Uncharacterised protein [Mycobacterium tuberculosis]|nr:Uncharacterised protein [Mycobacterium tuberculosis]
MHSHVGHVALPPGTAVFVADSGLMRPGPRQERVGRPGVDDPVGGHLRVQGALGALAEEVQLAGCVRVGVDAEHAADVAR